MIKSRQIKHYIPKLAKASLQNGKLSPTKVKEIVDILKTLSKGNAIEALTLYLKQLRQELDQNRLLIESPIKLSNPQIDEIVKIVEKSHPVFETEVKIDPDLLAGFRLKIGDEVYEDSIADKINQLKGAIKD